jgi:hypothetical protein
MGVLFSISCRGGGLLESGVNLESGGAFFNCLFASNYKEKLFYGKKINRFLQKF